MHTVPAGPGDQHPRSTGVTLTTDRNPAVLRLLSSRERQRIADRLAELDSLAALVAERPFGRRWAA